MSNNVAKETGTVSAPPPRMEMKQFGEDEKVDRPSNPFNEDVYNLVASDVNADDGGEGILEKCFRCCAINAAKCCLCVCPCCLCSYVKIFDQYERGVHFRLGKVQKPAKGPGMVVFLPCVDNWFTIDLRILQINVPRQRMMTRDSVTVGVDAVVYYHVKDPIRAVLTVQNHMEATSLLAQTVLRSVIGESELDDLLSKRERVNGRITSILDSATDAWGIKVSTVEVKDVELPANMQRAMSAEAEAERDRRAKVISADGELQAAGRLLEAANQMTRNSSTMQLRYLQTLTSIAQEQNSTIVFPLPIEMFSVLQRMAHMVEPTESNM